MIRQNKVIPNGQIKLLVFDLDGTLVDSQVDLANAINHMLRHYHRPELPVDVVAGYIGDGATMLVRRSLGDPRDENFVSQAYETFVTYYREHVLDNTYAYPGVVDAIRAIRETANGRLQMAVLSNKPVRPSERILQGLGMDSFFTRIYGGNSFETKKPDPLGANTLTREAGAAPEETVMVGDSGVDILTARNAGLWSIGVTYGFAPLTLQHALPDVLVDTTAELTAALTVGEMPEEEPPAE